MTITLPQNIEEQISALPAEAVEKALLKLVEEYGHDREQALVDALQKGEDDIEAGRVVSASTKEEGKSLFQASRERVLEQARLR